MQLMWFMSVNDRICFSLVCVMVLSMLMIMVVSVMMSSSVLMLFEVKSCVLVWIRVYMLIFVSRLVNIVVIGVGVVGQEFGSQNDIGKMVVLMLKVIMSIRCSISCVFGGSFDICFVICVMLIVLSVLQIIVIEVRNRIDEMSEMMMQMVLVWMWDLVLFRVMSMQEVMSRILKLMQRLNRLFVMKVLKMLVVRIRYEGLKIEMGVLLDLFVVFWLIEKSRIVSSMMFEMSMSSVVR